MLAAQAEYAESEGLEVWGWANHSDPTSCDYLTCQDFTPAQATPYICAMGLDLEPGPLQEPISDGRSCWDNLLAFHETGADAPFVTGLVEHDFGLRDAWNQGVGRARHDAFLYLDTGWAGLGLLNACRGDLVRKTFASHRLAASLYAALDGRAPVCP